MEKIPGLKFRVTEAVTESGGVVPGSVLFQLKNAFGVAIANYILGILGFHLKSGNCLAWCLVKI